METQYSLFSFPQEAIEAKWETLQARVNPDEKTAIFTHCRTVIKLPYSVITRLIWRRIIAEYRSMPQVHSNDVMKEIEHAADDVMTYLPIIVRQRKRHPGEF